MVAKDPSRTYGLVLEAVRLAGVRAVVSGPVPACESVLPVTDVPHAWLFPRMAAVVHHGGAGTTAAGLRAGVPTVVCPFFGDQPYWGERVASLGAGPAPLPVKSLTAESLAAALRAAVRNPALRESAAAVADRLAAEDGVAAACEVLAAL
jgi:UDP:flavonoid glycosyltransferase YjiC (YdhE family)